MTVRFLPSMSRGHPTNRTLRRSKGMRIFFFGVCQAERESTRNPNLDNCVGQRGMVDNHLLSSARQMPVDQKRRIAIETHDENKIARIFSNTTKQMPCTV